MSRDLNKATPFMREFAKQLIAEAKAQLKLTVIVTDVDRDYKTQMALFAQGRQILTETNLLRKVAGLALITAVENQKRVTWTMASKHIINLDDSVLTNDLSTAIDFGILDVNGKYHGDVKADINKDNRPDYIQLGELAEKIGGDKIKWGGRFRNALGHSSPDFPHFEEK